MNEIFLSIVIGLVVAFSIVKIYPIYLKYRKTSTVDQEKVKDIVVDILRKGIQIYNLQDNEQLKLYAIALVSQELEKQNMKVNEKEIEDIIDICLVIIKRFDKNSNTKLR